MYRMVPTVLTVQGPVGSTNGIVGLLVTLNNSKGAEDDGVVEVGSDVSTKVSGVVGGTKYD